MVLPLCRFLCFKFPHRLHERGVCLVQNRAPVPIWLRENRCIIPGGVVVCPMCLSSRVYIRYGCHTEVILKKQQTRCLLSWDPFEQIRWLLSENIVSRIHEILTGKESSYDCGQTSERLDITLLYPVILFTSSFCVYITCKLRGMCLIIVLFDKKLPIVLNDLSMYGQIAVSTSNNPVNQCITAKCLWWKGNDNALRWEDDVPTRLRLIFVNEAALSNNSLHLQTPPLVLEPDFDFCWRNYVIRFISRFLFLLSRYGVRGVARVRTT